MMQIELVVVTLALAGLSILLGGSVYDAAVLAPNLRGGPAGLGHGRLFMSHATPAKLFRWTGALLALNWVVLRAYR